MSVEVIHGDMRDVLGKMVAEGKVVQSIVTDPPYHLTTNKRGGTGVASLNLDSPAGRSRVTTGFMGKAWDGGDIAFLPGTWRLCFELLPPGGHLLAFAGTRTYHRMAVAIEEAGFEIRDTIAWLYGSGFPKSHNVSKGIDRAAGAEREIVGPNPTWRAMQVDPSAYNLSRNPNITAPATDAARQWDGWGTALKPAMELICVARKPLDGTVAATVLKHGTGALNIDACRVEGEPWQAHTATGLGSVKFFSEGEKREIEKMPHDLGRWPANVCHDGSDEVVKAFPDTQSGVKEGGQYQRDFGVHNGGQRLDGTTSIGDSGSAARFFYSAKADADDRLGSKHPTVKPVDLMRWLVRLVTPPNGVVLDPFAGSGTTGMACMAEGFDCLLVEREAEYIADIKARIAHVHGDDTPLFSGVML